MGAFVLVLCICFLLADVASSSEDAVPPVPVSLTLEQLVVIHRHGDRSQISPSLGAGYPEHVDVRELWYGAMPAEDTRRLMQASAVTAADLAAADPADLSLKGSLYSGYDQDAIPYAQLTERGSRQLLELGRRLRSRYAATSLLAATHPHPPALHLRSSNLCRTLQSLKCLLAGLLDVNSNSSISQQQQLPFIHTISVREEETIFPQESTCRALLEHRLGIYRTLPERIAQYPALQQRMQDLFRFPAAVPWLNIYEVGTCHASHGIAHIDGLSAEDLQAIEVIVLHIWSRLYGHPPINRLALGRFISELLDDFDHRKEQVLIYSAHDTSLVSLLYALGAFDDVFPDYASYISLEIASRHADGRRMVRILYNDAVLSLPAGKGAGAGEELEGWLPMEALRAQLQPFAVTQEEYAVECAQFGVEL